MSVYVICVALLASVAVCLGVPDAAAEFQVNSVILSENVPAADKHTMVLQCTGTVLVYSMDLSVSGSASNYGIQANSMRVGNNPISHDYAYGNPLNVEFSEKSHIRYANPLPVFENSPLFITIHSYNNTTPDTVAVLELFYGASDDVACKVHSGLRDTVTVGLVLPLSGAEAELGKEILLASNLALDDFNLYLQANAHDWRLDFAVYDDVLDPSMSLDAATKMRQSGLDVVLGPVSSGSVTAIADYTGTNSMTVLSCCSVSPNLAVSDHIFRIIPPATNQAQVIYSILAHDDIDVLVPIYRNDTYGNTVLSVIRDTFERYGGKIADGVAYSVNATEPDYLRALYGLDHALSDINSNNAAVLLMSYGEADDILRMSANNTSLHGIPWYASTSVLASYYMSPEAMEVAGMVNLTGVIVEPADNAVHDYVKDRMRGLLEYEPRLFSYTSYDSVWVLGRALLHAQSTDQDTLTDAIPYAGLHNYGAMGLNVLDKSGDLMGNVYGVLRVINGSWVQVGSYNMPADILSLDG